MSVAIPALWCLDHPPLGDVPQPHLPPAAAWLSGSRTGCHSLAALSKKGMAKPTAPPAQCSAATWTCVLWCLKEVKLSYLNSRQMVKGPLSFPYLPSQSVHQHWFAPLYEALFYGIRPCTPMSLEAVLNSHVRSPLPVRTCEAWPCSEADI